MNYLFCPYSNRLGSIGSNQFSRCVPCSPIRVLLFLSISPRSVWRRAQLPLPRNWSPAAAAPGRNGSATGRRGSRPKRAPLAAGVAPAVLVPRHALCARCRRRRRQPRGEGSSCSSRRSSPLAKSSLLLFLARLSQDGGLAASWRSSTDCCTWDGVACNPNREVIEVSLSGSLPSGAK